MNINKFPLWLQAVQGVRKRPLSMGNQEIVQEHFRMRF